MTDDPQALHDWANLIRAEGADNPLAALLAGVADEIDALRTTNTELRETYFARDKECFAARAEVARLRAALTGIASRDQIENCLDPQWAARAARAALGEGT